MDNSDEIIHVAGEKCVPPKTDDDHDDPFDDPALVTNAFLDITWQDSHGNSALMLAAAENRILHVKGILKMATERGTLWQILDMRNEDGLTALEMAVNAGSDSCAMLITRFANEAKKSRPRLRGMPFSRRASNEASENDITIEIDDIPSPATPFASRRPFLLHAHPRRLSRDKITNNFRRPPPSESALSMKRTWPQQSKIVQRTISGDSLSSLPSPSNPPNIETNKSTSMGEKLRSIFSSKKPIESNPMTSIRGPYECKTNREENILQEGKTINEIITSNGSEGSATSEIAFRSPWPQRLPTRLPPLANPRRRAVSEGRIRSE